MYNDLPPTRLNPLKIMDEIIQSYSFKIPTHQSVQRASFRILASETFESDSGQKRWVEIVPETKPSDLVDPSPSVFAKIKRAKVFWLCNEDAVGDNGVIMWKHSLSAVRDLQSWEVSVRKSEPETSCTAFVACKVCNLNSYIAQSLDSILV